MIEAIKDIGEYVLSEDDNPDVKRKFLENITVTLEKEIKRNKQPIKQHVVFINFNTKKKKIFCEEEDVMDNSGKKYLWFGTSEGNKPQIFFTVGQNDPLSRIEERKIKYIFTKTFPSLIKNRLREGNLKNDVKRILNNFFIRETVRKKDKDEVIDIINPEKFDFFDKKVKNRKKRLKNIQNQIETEDIKTEKDLMEKIIKVELKKILGDLAMENISETGNIKEVRKRILSKCRELTENEIKKGLLEKYKNLKKLEVDIVKSRNLDKNNVSIYSVKLNGKLLSDRDEYIDMAYNEKLDELFNKKGSYKNKFKESICSICFNDGATTSDSTNLSFKSYNVDKLGFSSNLDGKFTKNFNICKDCYKYLMVGERFTIENLRSHIGRLHFYVIPAFIFKNQNLNLKTLAKEMKNLNDSIVNFRSIENFNDVLKRLSENKFVMNYLFYTGEQPSEFKVSRLIKDVPPTRLEEIARSEDEISKLIRDKYDETKRFKSDLEQLYYCFPIEQSKNKRRIAYSKYFDVLDAIFSGRKVDYGFLINQFTGVMRIIYFRRVGTNINAYKGGKSIDLNDKQLEFKDIDNLLTNKCIQFNFLLLFFKKLNILGGIDKMEHKNSSKTDGMKGLVPREVLNFWKDIEIYKDESKQVLFLLGYLIGEIGYAQDKKDIKNRPVLNKINFQGMDVGKLKRLSNDVCEKLIQYKILKYNEKIHSALKTLFDEKDNNWELSNQENVFYVLSGYAFSGYVGFQRRKEGIANKIKKKQKEIQDAKEAGKDVSEQENSLKEAEKIFNSGKKGSYKKTKEKLETIKINNKEVKND